MQVAAWESEGSSRSAAEVALRAFFRDHANASRMRSSFGAVINVATSGIGGGTPEHDPWDDRQLRDVTAHRRVWRALRAVSTTTLNVLWLCCGPVRQDAAIARELGDLAALAMSTRALAIVARTSWPARTDAERRTAHAALLRACIVGGPDLEAVRSGAARLKREALREFAAVSGLDTKPLAPTVLVMREKLPTWAGRLRETAS